MDRPVMTPDSVRAAVRDAVVMSVRERSIPGPGRPVRIRVYGPALSPPVPVLLYFHGGGWVAGDLDTHDSFCRIMCEWAGCAVVAVDYARPPEYCYPAAVDDCYAVTEWVAEHGLALGIDSRRIAVAGGGSGGGLAAVICQQARDRAGPRIGFQLLLYPVLDCLARNRSRNDFAQGYGLTATMMDWYLSHYVPDGHPLEDPGLSPARHPTLCDLPQALIVTAGLDLLRDEGRAYARLLKKAGVQVSHREYTGARHGFINYPGADPKARCAILLCAEALSAHFYPSGARA